MTPAWQVITGPPLHVWENRNWAPDGSWGIWPGLWLMPAVLVLALAGGLAWLLLQRRTVDFRARMDQPTSPAPPRGPVLASEADREDTARALSAAIAEGRLSHDEGMERIGNAYTARHQHQLAALTADLPATEHAHPSHRRSPNRIQTARASNRRR